MTILVTEDSGAGLQFWTAMIKSFALDWKILSCDGKDNMPELFTI